MIVNGIEMVRVEFEEDPAWSELRLTDGTTLKIKAQAINVFRAVGKWDEHGEPMYQVVAPTIVAFVHVPDALMQPKRPVSILNDNDRQQLEQTAQKAKNADPYGKKILN